MSWHGQAKQPMMLRGRTECVCRSSGRFRSFTLEHPGQQGEIEMSHLNGR